MLYPVAEYFMESEFVLHNSSYSRDRVSYFDK